jgi:hypothetical protein
VLSKALARTDVVLTSGQTIFLKSHAGSGQMLDVEDSLVRARWEEHGAWQAFLIETLKGGAISSGDVVFLKSSYTGSFLDVEGEHVQARWSEAGTWQALTVEKQHGGPLYPEDIVCFQAHTGKYIDVNGGNVRARWNECGEWQKMRIEVGGARRLLTIENQSESLQSGLALGVTASLVFFMVAACLWLLILPRSVTAKLQSAASSSCVNELSAKIHPKEESDDIDMHKAVPASF